MQPYIVSAGITAAHFFLAIVFWSVANRLSLQGFLPILGAYLILGPLPYLHHAYNRQQRFVSLTQLITYVLGLVLLLMTLGFVWQCKIQVLKIRIPLVVTDPPWMTTLLVLFVGVGVFLSYLMVQLSALNVSVAKMDRKVGKFNRGNQNYPDLSDVTNPHLIGIIQTDSRQD